MRTLGRNRWLERFLLPLVRALRLRKGELWAVCDAAGRSLPLAGPLSP